MKNRWTHADSLAALSGYGHTHSYMYSSYTVVLVLANDLRGFKVGQIHTQIIFIGPLSCTPVINCASIITESSHRSNSSTAANLADQLSRYTSNKLAFFTSY